MMLSDVSVFFFVSVTRDLDNTFKVNLQAASRTACYAPAPNRRGIKR